MSPRDPSRPVGLRIGSVQLASYDPRWPTAFAEVKRELARLLGTVPAIEHIGSTAVPDLDAKPIIDVAVGVRSFRSLARWARKMEPRGYVYFGDQTRRRDHFFARTRDGVETVYVHFVIHGSSGWQRYLAFRDRLRGDPHLRREYAGLKHQLAADHPNTRRHYTSGKAEFIVRHLGAEGR